MSARDGAGRRPTRFVILGKARCGSTFLRGLLNSHPRVLAFGELFRDWDVIGWDLPRYDRSRQQPELIALMQSDPARFLEEAVFGAQSPRIAAVGFKLFYYHAREDSRRGLWEHLRRCEDLHVIHLKRRNTLRELVSLRRAERTGAWYQNRALPDRAAEPFALEYEDCLREFESARDAKREFEAFFHGQPTLDLCYEELCDDLEGETGRVQRFLEVPVRRLTPDTAKQAALSLSSEIRNYRELKQRFRDTPWAEFFED